MIKPWLIVGLVRLLVVANSEEHWVLCRNCGRGLADPSYLHTKSLSPLFIERKNKTELFGSKFPVSVETLKNPQGFQFDVVSFDKAGTCLFSKKGC